MGHWNPGLDIRVIFEEGRENAKFMMRTFMSCVEPSRMLSSDDPEGT